MPLLTLYRGIWPQNVSRLAKFGVRFHHDAWQVCVLYEAGSGLRYLALDEERGDLARRVNEIKTEFGHAPGGAFYVNEYRHVIVPVDSGDGSSHYYFSGYLDGELTFTFEGVPLSTRPVRPDGSPLAPGDSWVGPRPGIPYVLAAGGDDVHYRTPALTATHPPTVRPLMTQHVKLSKVLRNPVLVRRAVEPIVRIRGHQGGRFYVNEHGAAFTPVHEGDGNGINYVYCGMIDRTAWFPEPRAV